MKRESAIKGLYCITPDLGTKKRYADFVKSACRAGADAVQFRFSGGMDNNTRVSIAKELKRICRRHNVPFIINNDYMLALYTDASGIHLGREDAKKMPVYVLRKIAGILGKKKFIIGISANTLGEAREAAKEPADYIGFGPVFRSPTKPQLKPSGIKLLKKIAGKVKMPVVAIGGINKNNIGEIAESGARAAAVISAVSRSGDVGRSVKEMRSCFFSGGRR